MSMCEGCDRQTGTSLRTEDSEHLFVTGGCGPSWLNSNATLLAVSSEGRWSDDESARLVHRVYVYIGESPMYTC